jgi:hypothetical protein
MKKFTVLTVGDVVTLPLEVYGEMVLDSVDLVVEDVAPFSKRRSIVVIDTDLELHFLPPFDSMKSPQEKQSAVNTIPSPIAIKEPSPFQSKKGKQPEVSKLSIDSLSSQEYELKGFSPFSGRGNKLGGDNNQSFPSNLDTNFSIQKKERKLKEKKGSFSPFGGTAYKLGS